MIVYALIFTHLVAAQTLGTSAGSVVRSKEWIVRRGAFPEEEFRGDVRYATSRSLLIADWALYRHRDKVWTAKGNVNLRQKFLSGDVIDAQGDIARYDEISGVGRLEPRPARLVTFQHTPVDGSQRDQGEGQRLDWNADSGTLTGRAHAWGPRLELWADRAYWERSAQRLELRGGRPVLKKNDENGGWITALKADEVDATQSPRRIEARGRVVGWILFSDKLGRRKEPAR